MPAHRLVIPLLLGLTSLGCGPELPAGRPAPDGSAPEVQRQALDLRTHLTALELIERDYNQGLISTDDACVYRQQAVDAPEDLPSQYRSRVLGKDGSDSMARTAHAWPTLSATAKQQIQTLRATGLGDLNSTYETPHFVLHYTTQGVSAVPAQDANHNGVSDYIDTAAEVVEHVWDREINQLGYPPPRGMPQQKFHIYFKELSYYGTTVSGAVQLLATSPIERTTAAAYIICENDFAGFPLNDEDQSPSAPFHTGALKVTLAHEFMHAIQFNINFSQDVWLYEAHATWTEDQVYDNVNDWRAFVDFFLADPEHSVFNRYLYGAAFYLHWVSDHYGVDVMRRVWEGAKTIPMPDLFRIVVFNNSWEGMKDYAPAEYLLGLADFANDPPSTVPVQPPTVQATYSSYPVSVTVPPDSATAPNHAPWGLGANFVEFYPGVSSGSLQLSFNGQDGPAWRAFAVATPVVPGPASIIPLRLDGHAAGSVSVSGFGTRWSKVTLVPTLAGLAGQAVPYSYSASVR